MKRILAFMCLILISSPSIASNWFELDKKTYVDTESIQRDYSTRKVTAWYKILNNGSIKNYANQKVWYAMSKTEIDCDNEKIRGLSYHLYGLKNNHIDGIDYSDSWESIIPDTNGDYWRQLLCNAFTK